MRKNRILNVSSKVAENRRLAPGLHLLTLAAPGVAANARPGQFVMVAPEGCRDPLLKRAFSIARIGKGVLSVYFEVKGRGTQGLSRLKAGDRAVLSGPLGNGFPVQAIRQENVLIAGGCGLAPLWSLAETIRRKGKKVLFYYGARSASCQPMVPLIRGSCHGLVCVTDDGSAGKKGLVTDYAAAPAGAAVFACGPQAMLRTVGRKFPEALVALETPMACGLGVCMGCAIRMADGAMRLCCKDGPVFKASEVAWD
jgi:dihydroorotate dehydrogenase electron transfer subunit